MATPVTVAEIVEDLYVKDYFYHSALQTNARKWFTNRIAQQLADQGAPPEELHARTLDLVRRTRDRATSLRIVAAPPGETPALRIRRHEKNNRRVEAAYGIVGGDLAFLEPRERLVRLVERRARAVDRMEYEVGYPGVPLPARPGFIGWIDGFSRAFEYPQPVGLIDHVIEPRDRLSDAARAYWKIRPDKLWVLTTPADRPAAPGPGSANPRAAVEALFTRYNDYINRNWFYCEQVAMILHMDALAETGEPDIYQRLAAINESYLRIGNPMDDQMGQVRVTGNANGTYTITMDGVPSSFVATGRTVAQICDGLSEAVRLVSPPIGTSRVGNDVIVLSGRRVQTITVSSTGSSMVFSRPRHVTNDPDPATSRFEQLNVDADSLHVGDHVYVVNHPLYPFLTAGGYWQGEHSLVVRGMGRDIKLQGHGTGVESMESMRAAVWIHLNGELKRAREQVLSHWAATTEPDGVTAKPANDNGQAMRLAYGGWPDNLRRNESTERALPANVRFACWNVIYGTETFYLFAADGTARELPLEQMPELLHKGIGGLRPDTVWVLRPR